MDNLGNRTATVGQRDADHTYSVNALTNRYTAIDSISLAYDDAGNLTIDKDGYHYSYDYENRPVEIRKSNDTIPVARFAYDALGRRIKKEDMLDSTKTRYYYYSDNWQVLAEYNGSGTLQAWYAYGNYIDEVLLMSVIPAQAGIQNFYYLHDHLYSPAALLDSSGSVVERYEYDAYGTIRFLSPNYELRTTSSYGNCIAFTGREIDQFDFDAGTPRLTKMHYRHREYSPFMGRFLQRDPLGVNPAGGKNNSFDIHRQYIDGLNLYEYVKENPIIGIDPQGLDGDWNRTLEKFTWWYIHESEKGAWWEGVLPKCPLKLCKQKGKGKFENPDPSKWNDPQTPWSMEERLHPGIKISMRSKTNKEHSNQCTYNIQGDLYLDPSMSGTVDWIAPNSIERHLFNDVYPIHWAVYLDYGIEMHVFYGPHTPTSVGYYMNLYYKVRPLYKE